MWVVPACCFTSEILVSKMGRESLIKMCCAGSRAPARRWPGCADEGGVWYLGQCSSLYPRWMILVMIRHQPLMHPGNKLAMLGTLLQILAATICLQSPGNRNLDVLDLGLRCSQFHLNSDPISQIQVLHMFVLSWRWKIFRCFTLFSFQCLKVKVI